MFRKRQNVCYVKLQEDISTLNSEEDYTITLTSIYGPETVRFPRQPWPYPSNLCSLFRPAVSSPSTTRTSSLSSLSQTLPSCQFWVWDLLQSVLTPAASMREVWTRLSFLPAGQTIVKYICLMRKLKYSRLKEPSLELESFPVTDTPMPDFDQINQLEICLTDKIWMWFLSRLTFSLLNKL